LLPFVTILVDSNGQLCDTTGSRRSENLLFGNNPGSTPSYFTGGGGFYRAVKIPISSETHPLFETCRTVSINQRGFFGKFRVDKFFSPESARELLHRQTHPYAEKQRFFALTLHLP